jgi:hypothetical protein
MNWKLIIKDKKNQPASGTYSDWKEQIADECFKQCVYCSIHEGQFGGIDHYHIDHFRPKSIKRFKKLENDILNLFYSCPICNRFKSNDWKGNPNLNRTTYPDPSKIDYSILFTLKENFEIAGKYVASKYIIIKLALNRSQLIMERREGKRRTQVGQLIQEISDLVNSIDNDDLQFNNRILKEIDAVKTNLLALENKKQKIRPYKLKDIRKS